MGVSSVPQTAKISSLDAARAFYLVISALAVRQALLFLSGTEVGIQPGFPFLVRLAVSLGFVFTVFRFSHGVALVYDLEKKIAETSTTPSSKRVELIFCCLVLEAAAIFLMSTALGRPNLFVFATTGLVVCDLLYICVSRTLRDAWWRLLNPLHLVRRWRSTCRGTAPWTHIQWALSDWILVVIYLTTLHVRPRVLGWIQVTQSPDASWAIFLSSVLILIGFVDYWMNGMFYFGKRHRGKRLIFVASPLKANSIDGVRENIRRAQWYCRELYVEGNEIPFASHGFYPYFLDDNNEIERMMGTKCALEFLAHCDALYLYTSSGTDSEFSDGMKSELAFARIHGLEIKVCRAHVPPEVFMPVWAPLKYLDAATRTVECADLQPLNVIDLERPWKRVFVCSPLREDKQTPEELRVAIQKNIRLAQWICHCLVTGARDCRIAPVAPHAFFPYFTEFNKNKGLEWLKSALDVLRTCESIYVYTESGLETKEHISQGMRQCIDEARALGIEVRFWKYLKPPDNWNPQTWSNPVAPPN